MNDEIENNTRTYYDPRMCGTENYHQYVPFGNNGLSLLLTDAVKAFAQEKAAWWTVDMIYSYLPQLQQTMKANDTNIIFLHFDVDGSKCEFYANLDTDMPKLFEQQIPYTDLDVSAELYLQDGILMFPSDY